jgi:hypothetical protein
VPSTNIRRIKTAVDNLHLEKQKIEKGDKQKKTKGAKGKGARLKMDNEGKFDEFALGTAKYDDYDEYDDFM